MAQAQPATEPGFGRLLRQWRAQRGMSQLDLSVEAGVSSRHLSFVETGPAQASREMVLLLARVLDVPLRDRNDLLVAAGYAPIYRATALDAPAMGQVRRALDFILRQQEPYPAHRARSALEHPRRPTPPPGGWWRRCSTPRP